MQSKTRVHADPIIQNPDDQFDRIPDSIVLLMLNKLADVRSLGRCSSVSRRFNALVPLVHNVHVKIDHVVTVDGDADDASTASSSPKPRSIFSHLLKFMLFTLFKPFNNLRGSAGSGSKPIFPRLAHRSPAQVLKNFTQVRSLTIELPTGDVGTDEGVLLKWRAVFGSTLQSCVILGGVRIERKLAASDPDPSSEDSGSIPESFYSNGGLKLRVVWTISSLIAASTRHFLLRPIIKDHPTLRSLVLTDADGQGTLVMGAEQLKEFREKPLAPSASSNRTQVPASNMKLRYAPYLDLPNGSGMQGATLIAIRPSLEASGSNHTVRKDTESFVSGAFDGPYKAAVKSLAMRRTYLLEMNGF